MQVAQSKQVSTRKSFNDLQNLARAVFAITACAAEGSNTAEKEAGTVMNWILPCVCL